MKKKKTIRFFIITGILLIISLAATIATFHSEKHETIKLAMRDAVLHDINKVSVFGLAEVDPSLIAGFIVTAFLLLFALFLKYPL